MTYDHTNASKDRVLPDSTSYGTKICAYPPDQEAMAVVQHSRCREVEDVKEVVNALLRRDTVEGWMIMCVVDMCRDHTAHIQLDHPGLLSKLDRVAAIIEGMDESASRCDVYTSLKKLLKAVSIYEVILQAYLEDDTELLLRTA